MIRLSTAAAGAAFTIAALLVFSAPLGAQTVDDDQVVASVNDSKIHFRDVREAFQSLPEQYRDVPLPQIYQALIQQLVERRLVLLAAEKAKLGDDAEVQRMLRQARDRILERAYVNHQVEKAATEERLRARYEAEKGGAGGPEEVHARHILLESKEDAEHALAELGKGVDFAALAKKLSKGPSGAQGGDLGFFAKGDMVPEFAQAAFALKPGEVSAPVKTQFGWHIIKLVARRQAKGPSFAERAPALRQEIAREVIGESLGTLAKGAEIKVFNLDGTPGKVPAIGSRNSG
ncbi:MAG: peptidylprolyl isomerase [Alphaproteobacteria bacterium]|jgi:peptidyl-prolyl cis-trans isomerase C|nr:peptidylprolyl isomerase [Alphaproteobacteria bacterium]MDP6567069.1 peptidylprolyl isomerase [Alphaproteobacteria bacterium]MDP6811584.1 peptidylprolyl isomerase [Alphaproteobacteria bacterium]